MLRITSYFAVDGSAPSRSRVLASRSEDGRGEWEPFKDSVRVVLTGSVELYGPGHTAPVALPTGSLVGIQVLFDDAPLADTWRAIWHLMVAALGFGTVGAALAIIFRSPVAALAITLHTSLIKSAVRDVLHR